IRLHAASFPQRLKPALKKGVYRSGKPLRHPKANAKYRSKRKCKIKCKSSANAKSQADATVESHPCAKNAQGWGTRSLSWLEARSRHFSTNTSSPFSTLMSLTLLGSLS